MLNKKKKKKIRKNRYKTPAAKERKKLRLKRLLPPGILFRGLGFTTCLALICGGFILLYSWVIQTDWFQADRIEISGIERLKPAAILKQAEIKYGMNIFDMNISVIHERLIAHPWINKAEVIRMIPDGIEIRITEHKPVATIVFENRYIMNKMGVIFKKFSDELGHLPVVEGLIPEDIFIYGEPPDKPETEQLSSVLEILAIKDRFFRKVSDKKINRILVDREIGLTLCSDGRIKKIRIGFGNYPEKFKKLEDVVRYVTKNDSRIIIEEINLTNPDRIVIKPAEDTESTIYSQKETGGRHATT